MKDPSPIHKLIPASLTRSGWIILSVGLFAPIVIAIVVAIVIAGGAGV